MPNIQSLLKKASAGDISASEMQALHGALAVDQSQPFNPEIAVRAAEFGYFKWAVELHEQVRGKRVLDVGCGAGMDGLGFGADGDKA